MHQGEREEGGGDQIIHNDHCRNEITFFVHLFIALPENVAKKNVKTKPSYYIHGLTTKFRVSKKEQFRSKVQSRSPESSKLNELIDIVRIIGSSFEVTNFGR